MILMLKCDRCGLEGPPQSIGTRDDGGHYCDRCECVVEIGELELAHATKKEWLEATHLKDLHDLEKKIQVLREERVQ